MIVLRSSPCPLNWWGQGLVTGKGGLQTQSFREYAVLQRGYHPGSKRGGGCVAEAGKERKRQLSLGDQLLDYIEGGPKLRRWYGASEQMLRDGSIPESEEEGDQADEDGDAVLVTEGDSEAGQMVVLSLILKRRRVRVLVKDAVLATAGFGPYVEPTTGGVTDEKAVRKALRGVESVIVTGRVGLVAEAAKQKTSVRHLILLSQVGVSKPSSSPFAMFGAAARENARKDEAAVLAAGIPHSVIRTGALKDEPSGAGVQFGQGDNLRGALAMEDAAAVCVAALEAGPVLGSGRVFEVVNASNGASNDDQLVEQIVKLGVVTNS